MIAVFGSMNADLSFRLDTLPVAGQTLLARDMRTEPGGKGANQAVAAALDGAPVAMIGAVGDDALAGVALAGLRRARVDLAGVATVPGPTGCAVVATDRGGLNQIIVAPGANALARQDQVPDALLTPGTLLLTQMEADAEETAGLILRARRAGVRPVHNHAPACSLPPDALRAVSVLVVNEDEAAWIAQLLAVEATASALHAALRVTVLRTLGGAGVEWAEESGAGALAAVSVQVVDTTAAGDCFVGVLAAALDRGEPLPLAIGRANIAAALACTRPGSQGSLPLRDEIDAAIRAAQPG